MYLQVIIIFKILSPTANRQPPTANRQPPTFPSANYLYKPNSSNYTIISGMSKNHEKTCRDLPTEISDVTNYLRQQGDIELAILFGSLATGKAGVDSDVDLAIQKKSKLSPDEKFEMIEQLALITGRAVDLVDLRLAGEPILGQILKYGKRLLGSDAAYAEIGLKHLYAQADFVPYIERTLKERRMQWLDT